MNIINNIIHPAASADLTGYTYTKVYAGQAASPEINGVQVTMAAGSGIEILVKSLGGTLTNVYVIGYTKILEKSSTVING